MMLLLLLIPIAYVGIAAVLYFIAKTWKGKTFVILLFVLIPVADVIVGRIYFHQLCTKQAGQEIYRVVELGDEYYLKPGEADTSTWAVNMAPFTRSDGAKINKEKFRLDFDVPFSTVDRNYVKGLYISKYERVIKDKRSNEVLSQSVSLGHNGGWVKNNSGLHPRGGVCCPKDRCRPTSKENLHSTLLSKTFRKQD